VPFFSYYFCRNSRRYHALCQLALLPVLILTLGAGVSFSPPSSAETEAEYQKRLSELSQSIKSLQAEVKAARNSKDKLQQSLQTSEEDVAKYTQRVSEIKEALAREKKRLSQLQTQRAELVENKDKQQHYITEAIRHTYQLGQQSRLKLLLNQEDPERISRLVKYHDYIVAAHQQKITVYTHTLRELDQVEQSIVQSQQALETRHQQLAQRQKSLKQSHAQRQSSLAQLNRSLKQKGKKLSTLRDDRNHLQDLLDKATNALANLRLPSGTKAFVKVKGQLPLPTKGKIIHRFGSPQFDGQIKRNGIFIRNRIGAKVVSVHHGRVIFSDYLRGHGLLLILDHGDGYMSLYGHNQTLQKEIGDWVSTGESIATVGNSGGQQQVGLYFEIRHQGRPQNPQPWLKS
jgi:septal ring factor EnvC (AmiA/AmiB activator)